MAEQPKGLTSNADDDDTATEVGFGGETEVANSNIASSSSSEGGVILPARRSLEEGGGTIDYRQALKDAQWHEATHKKTTPEPGPSSDTKMAAATRRSQQEDASTTTTAAATATSTAANVQPPSKSSNPVNLVRNDDSNNVVNQPGAHPILGHPVVVAATCERGNSTTRTEDTAEQPFHGFLPEAESVKSEDDTPSRNNEETRPMQERPSHPNAALRNKSRRSLLIAAASAIAAAVLAIAIVLAVILPSSKDGSGDSDGDGNDGGNVNTSTILNRSSSMQRIYESGQLKCGVAASPVQGETNVTVNQWEGFDVDLCRAAGAAIFGEDGHVSFQVVTPVDRFYQLQSKAVDMLVSGTTYTMERDVNESSTNAGFSFSVPYMYEGVGFGGNSTYLPCAESYNTTGPTCSSMNVCVVSGTTHEELLELKFPNLKLTKSIDKDEMYKNLINNACQVIAGEQLDIATTVVRKAGFTGDYQKGDQLFSKEPLSIVTREDDPVFTDFTSWIIQALISAEARNIQQVNNTLMGNHTEFGDQFTSMFQDAVRVVGNWGDIYDRNLGQVIPRLSINELNVGTSGLIYALPFGNTTKAQRDGPIPNRTLDLVRDAGHITCGIGDAVGFAQQDDAGWNGFDVDFCRALSAAVFQGDPNRVNFTKVSPTNRFPYLASGKVDVLSCSTTITYSRDVLEPTAKQGFTFSQAVFFDELSYGLDPNDVDCVRNFTDQSSNCQICVVEGTTYHDILMKRFPVSVLVPVGYGDLLPESFANGDCNVIAGGLLDVAYASVLAAGYIGLYQIIPSGLEVDPLALVTRQDDQEWSEFVFWVVSSLIYAEENNITQDTANEMPLVNLFGSFQNMFRNSVAAVGNYGEIYSRNLDKALVRQQIKCDPLWSAALCCAGS